ncbi:MAG: DUF3592 domain-containing protein [Bacteroidetes bacterium]|nr:MAG: DUF3592 domain-containing protein [Bacteroidota bacterium]
MSTTLRWISRLAWLVPALLLFLAVNQGRVALELRDTLQTGTPVTAEVLDLEVSNRVDVTLDYVSLRIPLPDGGELVREQMALPHSLAPRLEGREEVEVRVQPGAAQDVVITDIAETQWRIAAMNAAMSLFGALLFGGAVFAWNRYLARQGDPGYRQVAEPGAA